MTKFAIFEFTPENAPKIEEVLRSGRIVEQGLFITDGKFGMMYRDKDDIGRDKEAMIGSVGDELTKAQASYLKEEATMRGHAAFKKILEAEQNQYKDEMDGANKELTYLNEHPEEHINPEKKAKLDELLAKRSELIKELTKSSNKKNLSEDQYKERRAEIKTLEDEIKPLEDEVKAEENAYEEKKKKLKNKMDTAVTRMTSISSDIKTQSNYYEEARLAKIQAEAFVQAAREVIELLKDSKVVNYLPVFEPAKSDESNRTGA